MSKKKPRYEASPLATPVESEGKESDGGSSTVYEGEESDGGSSTVYESEESDGGSSTVSEGEESDGGNPTTTATTQTKPSTSEDTGE